MLTYEEFKAELDEAVDKKPSSWRKGQAYFNYVEDLYGGLAREVQFVDSCDCFYDDEQIEPFIIACYQRYHGYMLEQEQKDAHKKSNDVL